MELELAPDADRQTVAAARVAAARAGLALAPPRRPDARPWWRAGLEDAISRAPSVASAAPLRYEAARSPRSTRGATRA